MAARARNEEQESSYRRLVKRLGSWNGRSKHKDNADVSRIALFRGDLDQVRMAVEEEPEVEPKADAIRGAAAIIRRMSAARQKREQEEVKRLRDEKSRESVSDNETVDWDGLRRRRTVTGQSPIGPRQVRKTLHPPLGMSRFPDEFEQEEGLRLIERDERGFFKAPKSDPQEHIHGLRSDFSSDIGDRSSLGDQGGPADGALHIAPSSSRRQFSFQNVFHGPKQDSMQDREKPTALSIPSSRSTLLPDSSLSLFYADPIDVKNIEKQPQLLDKVTSNSVTRGATARREAEYGDFYFTDEHTSGQAGSFFSEPSMAPTVMKHQPDAVSSGSSQGDEDYRAIYTLSDSAPAQITGTEYKGGDLELEKEQSSVRGTQKPLPASNTEVKEVPGVEIEANREGNDPLQAAEALSNGLEEQGKEEEVKEEGAVECEAREKKAEVAAQTAELEQIIDSVVVEINEPHRTYTAKTDVPYRHIDYLGHGSFGFVDKVERTEPVFAGQVYARKIIRSASLEVSLELDAIENEVRIIKRLNHQHIAKVVCTYQVGQLFGIIMLPVADSDLKDFLHNLDRNEDIEQRTWARERIYGWYGCLVKAVEYLHDRNVRHKDIKPANILVKGNEVYITDFGIARDLLDEDTTASTGTPGARSPMYCAPEIYFRGHRRGRKADIFSLGCVFLEMTTLALGDSIATFNAFRESNGIRAYAANLDKVLQWLNYLGTRYGQAPRKKEVTEWPAIYALYWTFLMMNPEPEQRPTALQLADRLIVRYKSLLGNLKKVPKFNTGCAYCMADQLDEENVNWVLLGEWDRYADFTPLATWQGEEAAQTVLEAKLNMTWDEAKTRWGYA